MKKTNHNLRVINQDISKIKNISSIKDIFKKLVFLKEEVGQKTFVIDLHQWMISNLRVLYMHYEIKEIPVFLHIDNREAVIEYLLLTKRFEFYFAEHSAGWRNFEKEKSCGDLPKSRDELKTLLNTQI